MKLCVNDILCAISYALDCVEKELVGSTVNHSKRVACIATFMGRQIGISKYEILDLTTCALLHDNALTEYIRDEYNKKQSENSSELETIKMMKTHCIKGEENMKNVPTYGNMSNVIKYHHEHSDGTGTFGVDWEETPLFSKIIHIADQIDVLFDFSSVDEEKIQQLYEYLEGNKGKLFYENIVDLFIKNFDIDILKRLSDDKLDDFLKEIIPRAEKEYDRQTIVGLIDIFAKIIDNKSQFTQKHSTQIAQKAEIMCDYYEFDEETKTKFYMAAGLHDIGKLAVSKDVLEKPDKLTNTEFDDIKTHAYQTYEILSRIKNMEDVVEWASLHHEKLDGTGYPFGKTADQLDHKCRIMACLDIYQALREERPYKSGFSHSKSIGILRNMAENNFIDGEIVEDIDKAFAYQDTK